MGSMDVYRVHFPTKKLIHGRLEDFGLTRRFCQVSVKRQHGTSILHPLLLSNANPYKAFPFQLGDF